MSKRIRIFFWSIIFIFILSYAYYVSFHRSIVLPIDSNELGDLNTGLNLKENLATEIFPPLGFFLIRLMYYISPEKWILLHFNVFLFFSLLLFLMMKLNKLIFKNLFFAIPAAFLLISQIDFIETFFHTIRYFYPFFVIFNFVAVFFFILMIENIESRRWINYGAPFLIFMILSIHTTPQGIQSAFVMGIISLFIILFTKHRNKKLVWDRMILVFLYLVLFSIPLIIIYLNTPQNSMLWKENVPSYLKFEGTAEFFFSDLFRDVFYSEITLLVILLMLFLSLKALRKLDDKHRQRYLILTGYITGSLILMIISTKFYHFSFKRSLLYLLPFIYILICNLPLYAIHFYKKKSSQKIAMIITMIFFILLIVGSTINLIESYNDDIQKQKCFFFIKENINLNESKYIFFDEEGTLIEMSHYYGIDYQLFFNKSNLYFQNSTLFMGMLINISKRTDIEKGKNDIYSREFKELNTSRFYLVFMGRATNDSVAIFDRISCEERFCILDCGRPGLYFCHKK